MSEVKISEYKGHPTIVLPLFGDKEFSFGVGKAKVILDHIEDIKKFVENNSNNQ